MDTAANGVAEPFRLRSAPAHGSGALDVKVAFGLPCTFYLFYVLNCDEDGRFRPYYLSLTLSL